MQRSIAMTTRRFLSNTACNLAAYKDKQGGILFTPGPLSTTKRVKEAMLVDYGSRDEYFIKVVKKVRSGLLKAANVSEDEYTCIPLQGSGSMGIESVCSTLIPKGGKIIILRNGAYGDRMKAICQRLGIEVVFFDGAEDGPLDLVAIEELFSQHQDASMVGVVHCETSTGVLNPITGIRKLMDKHCKKALYFVDAMSSFGGVSIDVNSLSIDVLVSSSNKCVQGVPGFSIILAKKSVVAAAAEQGSARSYCLDLCMQDAGLNKSGQFNNTPPVHSIVAFSEALSELEAEGGVAAREQRYKSNQVIISEGMKKLGFSLYLDDSKDSFGHIITSFRFPEHENWNFEEFYNQLNDRGFVIYPGKAAKAPCFRIGHIGDILPEDSEALLVAVREVLDNMGISQ
eukprot:TRINITY_DN15819_c0_g1_i2.p1 TRINITY_DN15819_c0_g1~~TRINITY_DN15819_c0_g1_i2.p1  ORF type:complete len:399 (+),score=99.97 TRINITY_DN15819_c0_g1_i2:67-1263(+)